MIISSQMPWAGLFPAKAMHSISTGVEVRLEPIGNETSVTVEHRGWETIPQEHVARQTFPDAIFLQRHGEWWQRLLNPTQLGSLIGRNRRAESSLALTGQKCNGLPGLAAPPSGAGQIPLLFGLQRNFFRCPTD
jgi:hypothetical protein